MRIFGVGNHANLVELSRGFANPRDRGSRIRGIADRGSKNLHVRFADSRIREMSNSRIADLRFMTFASTRIRGLADLCALNQRRIRGSADLPRYAEFAVRGSANSIRGGFADPRTESAADSRIRGFVYSKSAADSRIRGNAKRNPRIVRGLLSRESAIREICVSYSVLS